LSVELPYDPAIPLLGVYPDKTFLKRDTCTCMFIAALFTIAKTWKQPKCPLTDDWIRKMWYMYTMEYYSAIKKNKIVPFAKTWMEVETLILSEVSQKEKDKYHMIMSFSLESCSCWIQKSMFKAVMHVCMFMFVCVFVC
uniref:DUF1725 domain-containing protein n=1 Tax=Sus scrofa TaxID=9823 RepID=A0A8D1MCE5_PIG